MERKRSRDGQSSGGKDVPWPERIAAAFGLALVLGALGVLFYQAVSDRNDPPRIEVHVEAVHAQPQGGYLVRIAVYNAGDRTAAQVKISGKLRLDGTVTETSTVAFDYVPDHSRRRGGLLFARDPRTFALELRADGYVEP